MSFFTDAFNKSYYDLIRFMSSKMPKCTSSIGPAKKTRMPYIFNGKSGLAEQLDGAIHIDNGKVTFRLYVSVFGPLLTHTHTHITGEYRLQQVPPIAPQVQRRPSVPSMRRTRRQVRDGHAVLRSRAQTATTPSENNGGRDAARCLGASVAQSARKRRHGINCDDPCVR